MTDVIQRKLSVQLASERLCLMLKLGLTGLGVDGERVDMVAARQSEFLRDNQIDNIS